MNKDYEQFRKELEYVAEDTLDAVREEIVDSYLEGNLTKEEYKSLANRMTEVYEYAQTEFIPVLSVEELDRIKDREKTYIIGILNNNNQVVAGPYRVNAHSIEEAREYAWDLAIGNELYADEVEEN